MRHYSDIVFSALTPKPVFVPDRPRIVINPAAKTRDIAAGAVAAGIGFVIECRI
jgi:hypothetical protein